MPIVSSPLRSSALSSAEYDTDTETLTIVFRNGREYTYDSVPQDVYERLTQDPSPGSFYLSNIKDQY